MDQETIQILSDAGIVFMADIEVPHGVTGVKVLPDDLPIFLKDKKAFAAKYFEVSKTIYQDWLDAEGIPRCGAITNIGLRCKNEVSGGTRRTPRSWLMEEEGLCTVHGGASSREVARSQRQQAKNRA